MFNYFISLPLLLIVLSPGLVFVLILVSIFSKLDPQLLHEIFGYIKIAPQLLQVFIFDLNELKLIRVTIKINKGIKNMSSKIFPIKLNRKFKPKKGITINKISEYVNKVLFVLRNESMEILLSFSSSID